MRILCINPLVVKFFKYRFFEQNSRFKTKFHQAGVISNKIAFYFCTLFKASLISAKGGKAYYFRWVHVIWKASLPILNESNFHDMYVRTWWEIVEAKRFICGSSRFLYIVRKTLESKFHSLESLTARDWKSASLSRAPRSCSSVIVIPLASK